MDRPTVPDPFDPFNPLQLGPEASLNRTIIAALPGAEPRWVGRPAFELVSLEALSRLARCLGFEPPAGNTDLARALSSAIAEQDPSLAALSARVVDSFGKRLAHLIATLTNPALPHPGESAWRAAYLRYWRHVRHVWLGGGLAAAFGSALVAAVRAEAARLGSVDRPTVELAPHAGVLPLLGAIRSRPDADSGMVALDFGHSAVKRGIATVTNHQLVRLDLLPNRSVQTLHLQSQPEHVEEFVLEIIADTLQIARRSFGSAHVQVAVSVASYIVGGRPVASGSSLYRPLSRTDPKALEQQLQRRTGTDVHLDFFHDGTAAACGIVAAKQKSAVIQLGTALGVGFSPGRETLLPVSAHLRVADAETVPPDR